MATSDGKGSDSRIALENGFEKMIQRRMEERSLSKEEMAQASLKLYNSHNPLFASYCSMRIQVWWLFLMEHRHFLKERIVERLRSMYTGPEFSASKRKKKVKTPSAAASVIQRAWRRHIDVQVFKYYRDLINFKGRGDPAVMLRCINPVESRLMEPAMGTTVRFRLAGERFPPNIYYKIFTNRPIQDLCANSPKDYTRKETKILDCKYVHNKTRLVTLPQDPGVEHWYQRIENNGWRIVSDRLLHHILSDPVTWQTSKKTYKFHHSQLQRKQDVERRKKEIKIEWMKKMYRAGMLHAQTADPEAKLMIEGAAQGMVETVERRGPNALEEWEVDELLNWTNALNFDQYFSSWQGIACSAPADCRLDILAANSEVFSIKGKRQ